MLNSIKNKFRKNKLIMRGTLLFFIIVLAVVIYSYIPASTPTQANSANDTAPSSATTPSSSSTTPSN